MPAPEIRDPMDVDVDADAFVAAPGGGHGKVGHFGADAGKGDEAGDGVWYVGVVLGAEDEGGGFDVFCFCVVETYFPDEVVQLGWVDFE